jgi:outer membrane lipoprotein SlyB
MNIDPTPASLAPNVFTSLGGLTGQFWSTLIGAVVGAIVGGLISAALQLYGFQPCSQAKSHT